VSEGDKTKGEKKEKVFVPKYVTRTNVIGRGRRGGGGGEVQ
jgi:hypothetical protein